MTNEEILKRAIEKAVKGGYKYQNLWEIAEFEIIFKGWCTEIVCDVVYLDRNDEGTGCKSCISQEKLIFSHDFAKAFWGSEMISHSWMKLPDEQMAAWQYHLARMVLEEEPLKYIERFLDGDTNKS